MNFFVRILLVLTMMILILILLIIGQEIKDVHTQSELAIERRIIKIPLRTTARPSCPQGQRRDPKGICRTPV